ncbi:MAG: hypothetical protein ACXVAM_01995 [Vulcanimicrobiaceae bacterium]
METQVPFDTVRLLLGEPDGTFKSSDSLAASPDYGWSCGCRARVRAHNTCAVEWCLRHYEQFGKVKEWKRDSV